MTARHLLFRWAAIYLSQGTKEQLREMGYVNIYRHTECMISSLMLHRLEKRPRKGWQRKSISPGLLLGWQTNRWRISILMFLLTFLVSSIWCYPILIYKYLLTYIWAAKYTLCVFLEQSDPLPYFLHRGRAKCGTVIELWVLYFQEALHILMCLKLMIL